MKKIKVLALSFLLSSSYVMAQVAPAPSPAASVSQTVGLTKISVDYSRPSVKGREIFGKLIPFGKVWRTGANASTKIETSTDIMVNGQKLAAGKYAVLSFPEQNEWTVVFSKNLGVSEQTYKVEDDVLRVKTTPTAAPMTESFTIDFSDVKAESANLNISWATSKATLQLTDDIEANVDAAIAKQSADASSALQSGADYWMNKGNNEKALTLVDKSISLKETFRNNWVKSQILDKLGKPAEALSFAQKAKTLGEAGDPIYQFFKDGIEKGITDITSKIPAVPAAVKGALKKK